MTGFVSKAKTAVRLGLPNIARAASYNLGVKLGVNKVLRLQAAVPQGPFFKAVTLAPLPVPPVPGWQTSAQLFSHWPFTVASQPPDWLANPFSGQRVASPERDWWQIPDFDPAVGDIKLIWELSRMDWVLAFAQRARNGDAEALERLNQWLVDWCTYNPPYRGPNWKCGQEASIRVMNLAVAAIVLGQTKSATEGLNSLILVHLRRVAPTLRYAVAQDNNHGTSEAAALFIGGSWLESHGIAPGKNWAKVGRYWLENRVARLIGTDGGFSQYSLNYHRLLLDTLSTAELWRLQLALPRFSDRWEQKARAATDWLFSMINASTGDGPNVGANDGARLLQLTDTTYRDYRPSVQLAMALFCKERAYSEDRGSNDMLRWLGVPFPEKISLPPGNFCADDGGFAVIRRGSSMAMLRYPRFRFRPSQADALHVDLWIGGENFLRDAGSFSYSAESTWLNYFGGTAGHNTVQFDGRDQMPRLSRFLFGSWLKTSSYAAIAETPSSTSVSAGYHDSQGATHVRALSMTDEYLRVVDNVAGFHQGAVLRWRLAPGEWTLRIDLKLNEAQLTNGTHLLAVRADVPLARCELTLGWESRLYLTKSELPVLEIELRRAGSFTTEYRWAK